MKLTKRTMAAISRFSFLKKIALSDSFFMFYDAIFCGDFDRFARYGIIVKGKRYEANLNKLIHEINTAWKEHQEVK